MKAGSVAQRDALDEAVARIAAGGLVAFPTETIWGLAADSRSDAAVARLRSWKLRAEDQPLSVLVTNVHALPALGVSVGRLARELADTFWPGPLTMVLPCSGRFASGVAGPEGGLGVRCSPHPVAASLARALEAAGVGPITATSLNRHGEAPALNRAEASRACAEGDAESPLLFLGDGLDAGGGRPSTVVDLTGTKPNVLRWGALGRDFLVPLLRGTMVLTDVRAFRALRYDPSRVDLGRVVVPPYDVIAADERAVYWDRDPHNAIRLELTRSAADEAGTDYSDVAQSLAVWQQDGALLRDATPALYALRQRFTAPDGHEHVRDGFFAALHLEDYARRIVRPHERTLTGPKADRLKQMRATSANLSSVFLLYEDAERKLNELLAATLDAGPAAVARDAAGVEHRLVPVADPAFVTAVRAFLADRAVVIADGHHRYETALAYRDEQRAKPSGSSGGAKAANPEAPYEFVLAYFANAYAPGTLLLPIHRVVREVPAPDDASWTARLPGWSQQRVALPDVAALPVVLEANLATLADRHAFAADDGSGTLRIFSRSRAAGDDLSIRVLHAEVLQGVFGLDDAAVRDGAVAFPKHAPEAAREVRGGRGTVALYLNPLAAEDVFRVTGAGEILPQKSTFFHPKLPSGLVFRLLDERDRG